MLKLNKLGVENLPHANGNPCTAHEKLPAFYGIHPEQQPKLENQSFFIKQQETQGAVLHQTHYMLLLIPKLPIQLNNPKLALLACVPVDFHYVNNNYKFSSRINVNERYQAIHCYYPNYVEVDISIKSIIHWQITICT